MISEESETDNEINRQTEKNYELWLTNKQSGERADRKIESMHAIYHGSKYLIQKNDIQGKNYISKK